MALTSSHNIPNHQNNNQHMNNVGMNMSRNKNNINIIFVQADLSNFRSVVQKLTGHESNNLPSIGKSNSVEKGPQKRSSSTFKLHERRHSATKLENIFTGNKTTINVSTRQRITSNFLASPVSPLEMLTCGISPRSTMEEEERAIAEKRFYLHPNTPRASQPPQLLSLFPLHSPTATHHH